jgi:hypothetical protein
MADDDDDAVPEANAGCKPFLHKERADTLLLEFREHRHRRKGKGRHTACFGFKGNWREQDVPHNRPVPFCNQLKRRDKVTITPQGIDQRCLSGLAKRTEVYLKNGSSIGRGFFADCDIMHLSILSF